ncbi:glycine/sarcosine/betaine reductase complex component C subunit beta [Endozoicomonas euniceicola]|uniref:Glycine/sarcosine/betaine reductase complex component C subunit beta n=1 Tax=Endozoicomonas euniceicola TaxID=1234143 RepID=A0ABY6GYP6_9GAMM|nr:glycine/sarcosine/betaine reductase complex component C subunit beta [Endozoicomonas euniceicola]UYM17514.1 glycine/sarcosine/betaine reductase complex component C subunit beta [Endozoicomonas euniceicola]
MDFPVIKGASYILAHTPDFIPFGSNQVFAKKAEDHEYLSELKQKLRPFKDVVAYPANQCFIGNLTPEQLDNTAKPWYQNAMADAERFGRFGEIMPQEEFFALLKHSDVFDLVKLTPEFIEQANNSLSRHPLLSHVVLDEKAAMDTGEMHALVEAHHAEPLTMNGELVGCVKQAHDQDENLSAHIILENLSVKASGVLAALHLKQQGMDLAKVDYIIECSEEACGDINQRGGGNFAKSIGELAGCEAATGSDLRGFCAAPAHAIVHAAALVKSGVFKNVMVVAGGAVAKLAMNGRDHLKKDVPVLEDALAGFATIISENDGVSPIVNTDIVGRHTIGTGSSPQAVVTSLVSAPLKRVGMSIPEVDRFSTEMQNAEITKPAGAGDVPEANYKMIAALAVKEGHLERKQLMEFVKQHGIPGYALTQGHIPSGVPYLGHGRDAILNGDINNFMVVGKGSLFLGRMTNQFDGISTLIEKNRGIAKDTGFDGTEARTLVAEAMKDVAERLLEKAEQKAEQE